MVEAINPQNKNSKFIQTQLPLIRNRSLVSLLTCLFTVAYATPMIGQFIGQIGLFDVGSKNSFFLITMWTPWKRKKAAEKKNFCVRVL